MTGEASRSQRMRDMHQETRRVCPRDDMVWIRKNGRRVVPTIDAKASITLEGAQTKRKSHGIQSTVVANVREKDLFPGLETICALLRLLPGDTTKLRSAIEDTAPPEGDREAQPNTAKGAKASARHQLEQDDPRQLKTSLIHSRRSWDHCHRRKSQLCAPAVEVHTKAIQRASMRASRRRTTRRWTMTRSQTKATNGATLSKHTAIASDGSSKGQRGSRQLGSARSR